MAIARDDCPETQKPENPAVEFSHVDDNMEKLKATSSQAESQAMFTPEQERKILHRIDRRLVVTVGVMYCISLMDRTNMSAANIAGMSTELDLHGMRYVSLIIPPPVWLRIR